MRPTCFAVAWLALTSSFHAVCAEAPPAGVEIVIEGLKPDLEEAVRAGLTLRQYHDRAVSDAQLRRLIGIGEEQIRATLEAWGYYDCTVESRIESTPSGNARAWFGVTPGEPAIVSTSSVTVSGDAAEVPAVRKALTAFVPKVGERFDHLQYETSKAAIQKALADTGFLAAQLTAHRVELRTADRSANIELTWQSGPRHRFGPVSFSGSQFSREYLDRFLPWREGDDYSSAQLLELQQRLVGADYFATVTVQPQLDKAVDHVVPVQVELAPAKRDVYSAAVYASTDRGAGVNFGVTRRWLNALGHKGQVEVDVAQRYRAGELSYRIPLPGRRQRMLSLAGTYEDEETASSVSETFKLATNVSRKWDGYTFVYGLQWLAGDFEIGSERGNSSLIFFETALTRSKSDSPVFAQRGYSVTAVARVTPVEGWTDTSFTSLDIDAKWLHALGQNTRVILRSEIGAMTVGDFDELPPELRFFAGGDRSIRGFGYEEIGSRNDAGDVIGGNRLLEISAELERYWRNQFGAAVFVDAGDAFLNTDFSLHVGVGAGLRWKSPVGVLRLDLAYPVESVDANSWQLHFSIGPDL